MSAGNILGGARGTTLGRLAVFLFVIVAVFLLRDTWLPHAQSAYQSARVGNYPWATHKEESTTSSKEDVSLHAPLDNVPAAEPTTSHPVAVPQPSNDLSQTSDEACKHLPGADKVLVMLKTGATELYQKLPTHFVTTFKCIPRYMIFSDLEQQFGEAQIHDAIAPVSKKTREEHEDFKLYREIQKWQEDGQDMGKLKGDSGWNLDKWKFMPMLHMAFEEAPGDIEWFVMIEADTSMSWLNLLLWLKTMDPKKPYYLGAQNMIGDTTFAHGGSGIVMSRGAADVLEAARVGNGKEVYDEAWEGVTKNSCCGDEIVARAFLAVDIPLTPAWPLIQGETISTVDFTDNHWCTPPITFHHVTPIEVDAHWRFEKKWTDENGFDKPYLYRDIFAHFIEDHIAENRTDWNNLSKDKKLVVDSMALDDDEDFYKLQKWEQEATESQEACAEACQKYGDQCVQWMFTPGRCHLGRDIRFGKSDARDNEHWNCGWRQDRVAAVKKALGSCSKIRWEG